MSKTNPKAKAKATLKPTLECHSCFEEYSADESTAQIRYMYCSVECESAEEERIKEGNKIVSEAEALNPLFEQEQKQVSLKNMPLAGILNFAQVQTKKES